MRARHIALELAGRDRWIQTRRQQTSCRPSPPPWCHSRLLPQWSVMKELKIVDVRLLPLIGQTPDGGWDPKFSDPNRNLHTLVEVVTDQGITGLGSVYTSL